MYIFLSKMSFRVISLLAVFTISFLSTDILEIFCADILFRPQALYKAKHSSDQSYTDIREFCCKPSLKKTFRLT